MPATADASALGRYLRVRRALADPGAAGVPGQGNRRVPGLRREEVAFLAGVSSDYYVRLEQGRDRHPSDQVLLAIARALQLDQDATAYLLQLAKPPGPRSKRTRRPEKASDGIRTLIASWPLTPATSTARTWTSSPPTPWPPRSARSSPPAATPSSTPSQNRRCASCAPTGTS